MNDNALELHAALIAADSGIDVNVPLTLIEHAMNHEFNSMPKGLGEGFQLDRAYRRAFHAIRTIKKVGR